MHLQVTRELGDRLGEGRACYNLGNVHHAVGKSQLAKNPEGAKKSINQAIEVALAARGVSAEGTLAAPFFAWRKVDAWSRRLMCIPCLLLVLPPNPGHYH